MKFNEVRDYIKKLLKNSFRNKSTLDKLSEDENGTLLFNNNKIEADASAVSNIDDTLVGIDTTWSSSKIQTKIDNIDLHTHDNKDIIDKLSENNGVVLYDGKELQNRYYYSPGVAESYSKEEKIVGCWYNGKPIYRKLFLNPTGKWQFHNLANIWTTIFDTGITDAEDLVTTKAYALDDTTLRIGCCMFKLEGGALKYYSTEAHNYYKVNCFILEYTKTSDAENSYTTDMVKDTYLDSAPIGNIISYMGNSAPEHYLTCDGSVYNIVQYKELANHFIKTFGSANHFGGDGVTTFAVPNLLDKSLNGYVLYYIKYSDGDNVKQQYSTNETVIGTWHDGKPVYRRVIIGTVPATTANGTVVSKAISNDTIENIDTLVSMKGNVVYQSNGNIIPMPWKTEYGYRVDYFFSYKSGNVYVRNWTTAYNNAPTTFIIEYTKTTD